MRRLDVLKRIPRVRTLPPVLQQVMGGAESAVEVGLIRRMVDAGLPAPETQLKIIPGRRFRFDVGYRQYRCVAECQGSVHAVEYKGAQGARGRHLREGGYRSDAIKSALAQIEGWIVIYCTPTMIYDGTAVDLITQALKARGWKP